MLALFAAILIWEEVWDLPNSAALSGWLLILITAGAVACSAVFERRLWCRHLCPIGAMNGLFAKASMTEVRAAHGVCAGMLSLLLSYSVSICVNSKILPYDALRFVLTKHSILKSHWRSLLYVNLKYGRVTWLAVNSIIIAGDCTSYHCYKGGPAEGQGLETAGCPLASHPAQLVDNANCVLCMDCLKACPHGSVQFRLRPPLADLWGEHKTSPQELSLLLMLLGAGNYSNFLEEIFC